ncbi:MAG: nucleotidyltransferase family protein [Nanoarchaeota archaeon]|nr:nucleotidyltransferase family protein [Nanoarchaeota archaeon]MBU1501607.1 nucleotidyltransferase family protein [Nanoarchaeota archaeon]
MERTNSQIEELKKKILPFLKRNKIKRAGIFGSYACGEQKKNSDVDILVEFKGSLLALAALEMEIEKAFLKKVDLITYNGLSPYLKDRILKEEVRII